MKFNAATKALLHENPKTLQFLHCVSGFDFTKPFYTIQGKGRFTYNQIEKQIAAYTRESVSIAMFLRCKNEHFSKLYYVPIRCGRFDPVLPESPPLWDYNLDDFFTRRHFEEARKEETDHYYVVAQATQYRKPRQEKPFAYDARYNVKESHERWFGNGVRCVGQMDLQSKNGECGTIHINTNVFPPYELETAGTNIYNYIDKSGYYIIDYRHELYERLCVYKANNARNLVLQTDFTPTLQDLDAKIKTIRQEIVSAANAMQTYEECSQIQRTAYNLCCMFSCSDDIRRRIDNKKYTSLDSVQFDLDNFTRHYESALKIIGKEV